MVSSCSGKPNPTVVIVIAANIPPALQEPRHRSHLLNTPPNLSMRGVVRAEFEVIRGTIKS